MCTFTYYNCVINKVLWLSTKTTKRNERNVVTMQSCRETTVTIEEVVKWAYEEQGFEKPSIETTIWRLLQQGQIYQPEPGKIRKLQKRIHLII